MTAGRRLRIARSFAGAQDYDRHAGIQARVAGELAERIASLPLAPAPRVLEIGCGTGHLTHALSARLPGADWLITDLAPEMAARTQARLGAAPDRAFAVLDGEHGPPPACAPFDLICSSLAFQWFDDPAMAAARLLGWLRPGGWLAFTTLAQGTFAEWQDAHRAEGLTAGTPPFPPVQDLAGAMPGAAVSARQLVERHADAGEFLRAIKAIGAATPAPGHRPLGSSALRRVMRRFGNAGSRASYEVVTVLWQRPEA